MSAPYDAAPDPAFDAAKADSSVSEDRLKSGDTADIDQSNIIDGKTRGVQSNDAYSQERGVDKAVDSVLEGTQGGGST